MRRLIIGGLMIAAAHYTLLFVIAFHIVLPNWSGGYIMLIGSFVCFGLGCGHILNWLDEVERERRKPDDGK
ncbi:MAG: hypothetical protein KJ077_08615 [Anaerolineae bacterium]|nr:hypothetical protein [Anaerolineae bacterium]